MKKYLVLIFLIIFAVNGCKRSKDVEFCEGMDASGKGVRCGKKFEGGDITLVYTGKAPFEVSRLELSVSKRRGERYESFLRESIEVIPDDSRCSTNLSLNQGGHYRVEILKNGDRLSEGEVEIIDPVPLRENPLR